MFADQTNASWQSIAQQKRAQRDAAIPPSWRLHPQFLPKENGELENVLSVPDRCGLLTSRQCQITTQYDVDALLREITTRRLTAREVTLAFCKRAAIAQQLTNCLTEPLFSSALHRAETLDQYQIKHGRPWGPLHGLPVSLKDTFNVCRVDSSIGLPALCFKPARFNAPLVDLLLSLGCVLIAKTNLPQTVAALDSNNNVFGRTWNPINRLVTAGGSSGGEGALVAMSGSMIGIGTDIGGSIRVPAMCNGLYGLKPSVGRLPYQGQESGSTLASGRVAVQAVAGPMARSVRDLNIFMHHIVPRAEMWGHDCVPASLVARELRGSGQHGELVIGLLRRDGNCEPLPPIAKMLAEVESKLGRTGNFKLIEIPTPAAWTECQSVMNKLMAAPGTMPMADLIDRSGEPLVPWVHERFARRESMSFAEISNLQARRSELERQMLGVWYATDDAGFKRRHVDAIICPVAPHPVPPIDRWNAIGYTSSFVLLDYPAGVFPVRAMEQADLELGKEMGGESLGSWDAQNRRLWDEKFIDRNVYRGTSLSLQLVVPRLHDIELCEIMEAIDRALKASPGVPKL